MKFELRLMEVSKSVGILKNERLLGMKENTYIINAMRGGIINEQDLYEVVQAVHLSGAAIIDVFCYESYNGKLRDIQRSIQTAYMRSMSMYSRNRLEIEASEEVIRFLPNQPWEGVVPEEEYTLPRQGL